MAGKSSSKKGGRIDDESEVARRLKETKEFFGTVPFVPGFLSTRPDIFIPYHDLSKRVMLSPPHLDPKTSELAAVAAGSAVASEHCLNVHIEAAFNAGATKDEILESIMMGAFMSLTKSQAVALRKLDEISNRRAKLPQKK
jgi:4-carboxymuconolactone decarboxylase